MKTTRQLIMEFIRSQRAITAMELSRAFHMSPANARHHLAILKEQGLVVIGDQRSKIGKGRPARFFLPSRLVTGDNLEMLADVLLDLQKSGDTRPGASGTMARLIEEMLIRMSGQKEPIAGNMTQKLNGVTLLLNHFHYSSRWEAHVERPRMFLGNCPYASLIAGHPELCKMDTGIISSILGSSVVQVAKLVKDSTGLPYCQFLIGMERV